MKALLKQLIPPLLLKALNKSATPVYKTYEEAIAACQKDAYQNNDLVKVVVDKNLAYKHKIEKETIFDLGTLRTLIGLGLSKTSDSLSVIDFGGGGGYHYTIALNALGNSTSLRWNIVETTAMAREAQRIAHQNLKFFDNIAEAANDLEKVDLVFTSSALQYCSSPLIFLKQLTDINAKFIFLTRTPFTDAEEDIFSTQISYLSSNGPGQLSTAYVDKKLTYPITYMSQSKAEAILKDKYHIQFKIIEDKAAFIAGNKEIDMFGYFCVRKS